MKCMIATMLAVIPLTTFALSPKSASAQPAPSSNPAVPAQMLGTWNGTWTGTVGGGTVTGALLNQPLSITINDQQPHNEAQESKCRSISGFMSLTTRTGSLSGTTTGFYCPETGDFSFLLRRQEDREPMQVYKGKLSPDGRTIKGTLLYMAGDWGEYQFVAK